MPFLGRIPLDIAIRQASDAGEPPAAGDDAGGRAVPSNRGDACVGWLNQAGA